MVVPIFKYLGLNIGKQQKILCNNGWSRRVIVVITIALPVMVILTVVVASITMIDVVVIVIDGVASTIVIELIVLEIVT